MLIDCDNCEVRDIACGGCVVTTLLGDAGDRLDIDERERQALDLLAEVGLIPPLRHTDHVRYTVHTGGGTGNTGNTDLVDLLDLTDEDKRVS
jgi:hypothetical protein